MLYLLENQQEALDWIVSLLQANNISYVIIGGLAAKLYGSRRELADIDIGLSQKGFYKIRNLILNLITEDYNSGYKDEVWDLNLLVIKYKGQEFDLFDEDSLKFFSKQTKQWERINFKKVNAVGGYYVIKRSELIRYKSLLSRDVDLLDIEYLTTH